MEKKGSIRRKTPNIPWFSNVARSLGYTSTELVSSLTPSIGEFFTDNKEYAQDIVRDIRSLRGDSGRLSKSLADNAQFKTGKEILKNALSDIRSGNIYNKERLNAIHDDGMNLDGDIEMLDLDIDLDDHDEMEMDLDGDGETDKVVAVPKINVTVNPDTSGNAMIAKMVQRQTETNIRVAEASNNVNQSLASNSMLLQQKIGTSMLSGLETVNSNITQLVNFQNDSMSKYVGASLKYYQDSLQVMNDSMSELKKIVAQSSGEGGPTRYKREEQDDIFLLGGGLDMRAYLNQIKTRISNDGMFEQVKMILTDKESMKMFAASPMSFVATKVVTTLIPTFFQQSLESFNKSFASFFPALMMKISKIPFIGGLFGVDQYTKTSVNMGSYNRGPIPFDGETKKAITEVIPMYLRKMLAAMTQKEEIAFDWDNGKFASVSSMQELFERTKKSRVLGEYYDSIDNIKSRAESFVFANPNDKKTFEQGIEQFFMNLTNKNGLVNPYRTTDRDGMDVDELRQVFDFKNDGMQQLFRELIMSMDKRDVRMMFGKEVIDAKKANNRFFNGMEENPLMNNAANLFGADINEHMEKKDGKLVPRRGSMFNPTDKYGQSSLDYLRDIKLALLQGIRTFSDPSKETGGTTAGGVLESYALKLQGMVDQENKVKDKEAAEKARRDKPVEMSESRKRQYRSEGRHVVEGEFDLDGMSSEDFQNQIRVSQTLNADDEDKKKNKGPMQWIGRFIKGDKGEKLAVIREKIDGLIQKPARLLSSVFDRVDNTLHTLIFGKNGEQEGISFFSRMMSSMSERFHKMGDWMKTSVLNPIKESLVGENGIITKLKESEAFKRLEMNGKKFAEYLFGKEGQDGKRRDGLLSQTGNNMLDMWDGAKYYFTGNPYTNRNGESFERNEDSVFGQVRTMGVEFKNNVKQYLFGNKEDGDSDNHKGALTGILEGLSTGFGNFRDAIFGPRAIGENEKKKTFAELSQSVKNKMPKALAFGVVGGGIGALGIGSGLLGSMFLPGGPIGAAIVGTALGFATQSDSFMKWMFGDKDTRGERMGGFVSKKVQDFFKRNKANIIGGAAIGALNPVGGFLIPMMSFGLLPAMTAGPLIGAMTGIAGALALRSNTMQKFLFGEKDIDGKRAGGIFSKMFKGTKQGKSLFANMGAGALGGAGLGTIIGQFGLMGLAFGPITGAVAGVAAGIALSSDKWKKALFGEWDVESGKRKGGLLGKFQNFLTMEVVRPLGIEMRQLKLNFKSWFTESIANPFTEALAPMKQAFKNMTDSLNKFFVKGWESFKDNISTVFENNVGKPFGMFMKENVMDPMKRFMKGLFGGIGKIFKPLAEMPVKMLSSFTNNVLTGRHKQRGIDKMRESEDAALQEQRDAGYKVRLTKTYDQDGNVVGDGLFGNLNRKYFNRKYIQEAQYNAEGASYASPEEQAKRDEKYKEQKEGWSKEQEAIDKDRDRLNKYREKAFHYDFDNFTESGYNLDYIYRSTKNGSRFKDAMNNEEVGKGIKSSIADLTGGVTLQEILGLSADTEVSADHVGKKQSKLLKNAMKISARDNLKGDALRRHLQIGEFAPGVQEAKAKEATANAPINAVGDKIAEVLENNSVKPELREVIAPKLDLMNNSLTRMIESFKASTFGQFMLNEDGHIIVDSTVQRKEKPESDDTPVISRMERVATAIETLIQKIIQDISIPMPEAAQAPTPPPPPERKQGTRQDPIPLPPPTREPVKEQPVRDVYSVDHSEGPKTKRRMSDNAWLARIADYTKIVAREVTGQLDGVGRNVYLTRKILQKANNIDDSDLKGSANRDRVGFWGKMRRMMFKPFESIIDGVSSAVYRVTETVKNFGLSVYKVAESLITIPFTILKKGAQLVEDTFHFGLKILGDGFTALKETSIAIIQIGKTVAIETVRGLGKIFTGGLSFIGNLLHTAGTTIKRGVGLAIDTVESFARGSVAVVSSIAQAGWAVGEELTKTAWAGIKAFTSGVRGIAAASVAGLAKLFKSAVSGFLDVGAKAIGGFLNFTTSVFDTAFKIITAPFQLIGKGIGKMLGKQVAKEVYVTGGIIDKVHVVEKVLSGGNTPLPPRQEERVRIEPQEVSREVFIAGGTIDKIHVIEKLLSGGYTAPKAEEYAPIEHKATIEPIDVIHREPAPLEAGIPATSAGNPVINVSLQSIESTIYTHLSRMLTESISSVAHLFGGGSGGDGSEGHGVGGGINGSSHGFSGGANLNGGGAKTASGHATPNFSIRNGIRKTRNFFRRGGITGMLGRGVGRVARVGQRIRNFGSRVKNGVTEFKNRGIRGTLRAMVGSQRATFMGGYRETNPMGSYATNNGQYHPEQEGMDAVRKYQSSGSSSSGYAGAIGNALAGGGFTPSNLALRSVPVMKAEKQHMTTSRRNVGYELEQNRIREERAFLRNYQLTTMSHLQNLDNNVYEILEILRNWKKDSPQFEMPFPDLKLGGGKGDNNCCCCGDDDDKIKRKPDPTVTVNPVITAIATIALAIPAISVAIPAISVAIPAISVAVPAISIPMPKIIVVPMPIPGVVPGRMPKIPSIPGRIIKFPSKPQTKPQVEPVKKPQPKRRLKPGEKPQQKPSRRRKPSEVPQPKPQVEPERKPDTKPQPKPQVEPERKPDTKPDTKPEPKPRRRRERKPQRSPQRKPKNPPLPEPTPIRPPKPEKVPEKLPDVARGNFWGNEAGRMGGGSKDTKIKDIWDDFVAETRKSAFLPGTKKSIFRKDGPLRNYLRGGGEGSIREMFREGKDALNWMGKDIRNAPRNVDRFFKKTARGTKKLGKNIGKASKKVFSFADGVLSSGIRKVASPLQKIANTKLGKIAGKAAAPVFGAIGGYNGYQNTDKVFGNKSGKSTTGQKVVSTVAGALMGGTILGIPQVLSDDKRYSTEHLARQMYSLKNPKEWWNKYGKKEINPFSKSNGFKLWNSGEDAKPGWMKTKTGKKIVNGATRFGGAVKNAAVGALDDLKGGVTSLFFGNKVGAEGKGKDSGKIIAGKSAEDDFTKTATKKAKAVWDKLSGKTTSAWENVSKSVGTSAENIKKKTGAKWKSMQDTVEKKTADLKKATGEKWEGLKSGASKKWKEIHSKVTGKAKEMAENTKEKWDNVKEETSKKWKSIHSKVTKKAKEMSDNTKEKWDNVKDETAKKWKAIHSKVTKKAKEMSDNTKEKWDNVKEETAKKWKSIHSKVTKKAKEMFDNTKEKWDDVKTKLGSKWKDIHSKVTKKAKEMFDNTKEKWDDVKTKLGTKWKDIHTKVTKKAGEMYDNTKEKWDDVKTKLVSKWKDVHTKVTKKASEMYDNTKEKWDDIKTKVGTKWTEVHSKITKKAGEMYDNAKESWDDVKTKAQEKWDGLKKDLPKSAANISDGITGAFTSVKDAVVDFSKGVVKKATGIFETLFGGGGDDKPKKKASKKKKSKKHGGGFDILDTMVSGGGTTDENKLFGAGERKNGAVYYSQRDARWGGNSFGGEKKMSSIGCGPTSAAMALSTITGKNITPDVAAKDAMRGGFVNPELGTHVNYFKTAGQKYGVDMKQTEFRSRDVVTSLMNKQPVILRGESGVNGPFTNGGHYVVATGVDKKGKVLVNDPLSRNRSKAYDAKKLADMTTTSFVARPSAKAKANTRRVHGTYGAGDVAVVDSTLTSYGAGVGTQTSGPFKGQYVTSPYGSSQNATPPKTYHTGIDLVEPAKGKYRKLKAFTNGKILRVGSDPDGWGNYFIMQDENGYRHYYAHMSSIAVKQGQSIKKGSYIGNQGNTGRVYGAGGGHHLHYEVVKPGTWHGSGDTDVNPTTYLSKYKGKKSFIGDLINDFQKGADAVIGGAKTLLIKAKNKMTSWFDNTLGIDDLQQFKVLNDMTKAFSIYQFNAFAKDKMSYLLGDDGEGDFSGVHGKADYGTQIRKYDPKKKYEGKFATYVNEAAKRYKIEPQFIAAIIQQESRWDPNAGSGAGARGLMQLMPKTAASLGVTNVYDPYQNIMGGTKYITQQLAKYKNPKNALMAYNWGPGNASKANFNLNLAPQETKDYVRIILGNLAYYRKQVGGGYGAGMAEEDAMTKSQMDRLPHGGGTIDENRLLMFGRGKKATKPAKSKYQTKRKSFTTGLPTFTPKNPVYTYNPRVIGMDKYRTAVNVGNSTSNIGISTVIGILRNIEQNTGATAHNTQGIVEAIQHLEKETVVRADEQMEKAPNRSKSSKKTRSANPVTDAMQKAGAQNSFDQNLYNIMKEVAAGR